MEYENIESIKDPHPKKKKTPFFKTIIYELED